MVDALKDLLINDWGLTREFIREETIKYTTITVDKHTDKILEKMPDVLDNLLERKIIACGFADIEKSFRLRLHNIFQRLECKLKLFINNLTGDDSLLINNSPEVEKPAEVKTYTSRETLLADSRIEKTHFIGVIVTEPGNVYTKFAYCPRWQVCSNNTYSTDDYPTTDNFIIPDRTILFCRKKDDINVKSYRIIYSNGGMEKMTDVLDRILK